MLKYTICFDEQLKETLISKGYKKVYEKPSYYVFESPKDLIFTFENVDKKKYMFSNNFTMNF